jgi:hypothetical protein
MRGGVISLSPMTRPALLLALCVAMGGASAHAQQGGWRGNPGNTGHFPGGPPHGPARAQPAPPAAHQPAPPPGSQGHGAPARQEVERPHVDPRARWVGHESGPNDVRYHVDHPWAHGRFRRPIGRGHLYRIGGWDEPRRRFWFANSYFIVAEPDWAYVNDWDWQNDQVVLYDDPDHPGLYLAYNARLGTYAHVEYDGPT